MSGKQKICGVCLEVAGCALLAIGICNIAVSAEIPVTGISGISTILYRLIKFPIGISNILINIPIILISYKVLGRTFFLRSIRCMLIFALFTDYITPLLPVYKGDRMLAAICGGVFAGLGDALIYMQNSSTGGLDFINMAIKYKYPHLQLGNITFAAALAVIFISGLVFRDVNSIIYGLIFSFLTSAVINKMMTGFNSGMFMLIVTDQDQACCDAINRSIQRGSTVVEGYGSWTHAAKRIILCACSQNQIYRLEKAIKKADPQSFVVILNSYEVHGEGFRNLVLGNCDQVD